MSLGETALKSVMHEHAFLVSVLPKMSVASMLRCDSSALVISLSRTPRIGWFKCASASSYPLMLWYLAL